MISNTHNEVVNLMDKMELALNYGLCFAVALGFVVVLVWVLRRFDGDSKKGVIGKKLKPKSNFTNTKYYS